MISLTAETNYHKYKYEKITNQNGQVIGYFFSTNETRILTAELYILRQNNLKYQKLKIANTNIDYYDNRNAKYEAKTQRRRIFRAILVSGVASGIIHGFFGGYLSIKTYKFFAQN